MIYKIIHSDFEIDLRNQNIDYTEQNQWFVDGVTINYTLPLSLTLTQELDQAFGMISNINSFLESRSFDVKLHKMNEVFDAELIIESYEDGVMQLSFKYGFEDYPNFNTNLRLLKLEKRTVASLSFDSNTVINQSYPQTNYKYPSVIINPQDLPNNSGRFDEFLGLINNKDGSTYIQNSFDDEENKPLNLNIFQPFPYLMHVLKKGFEDAGFTLSGDILEDEKLKEVLVGCISENYINFSSDQQEWLITSDNLTPFEYADGLNTRDNFSRMAFMNPSEINNWEDVPQSIAQYIRFSNYESIYGQGFAAETLEISEPGIYRIAGNIQFRRFQNNRAFVTFFIDDERIYEKVHGYARSRDVEDFDIIDHTFEVNTPVTLQVRTLNAYRYDDFGELQTELSIFDATITKLASIENGNTIPALNESNEVDLAKVMPDKNFGDLVKSVMASENYDINIDVLLNQVIMNKVTNQITGPPLQDLSSFEVNQPRLETEELKSFLLKFQPSSENEYQELLFSRRGTQTQSIQTDENTQEINIDWLPMLNGEINGKTTVDFQDNMRNNIAVFFAPPEGEALTNQPTSLLIPQIFEQNYEDWLSFILFSKVVKFTNICSVEEALLLSVYKKSYIYNQPCIIRQIITRLNDQDYAEVEFELVI